METKEPITFALVCASNQNRSMAAHKLFQVHGIPAESYGTGSQVKLPGKTLYTPNVYNFGTPYEEIANDLRKKDEKFYTQNGLLSMLQRNASVKKAPQRWQDRDKHFDIVFCFEDRVFNAVIEDLNQRGTVSDKPMHILNLTIKDNAEEAEKGARECLEFCKRLIASKDWQNEISSLVQEFEKVSGKRMLHLCYFD